VSISTSKRQGNTATCVHIDYRLNSRTRLKIVTVVYNDVGAGDTATSSSKFFRANLGKI